MRKFSYKLEQFFKQLWEQTWLSEIIGFLLVGMASIWGFLRKFRLKK